MGSDLTEQHRFDHPVALIRIVRVEQASGIAEQGRAGVLSRRL